MLVLPQRAAFCQTPVQASLPPSLPEIEVFRLLIPYYDDRMDEWEKSKGTEDEMWHTFAIRIAESVQTDFGLGGKQYLVVSLEGDTGACTQCHLLVVGILDTDARKVVWKVGDESFGGPARLTLRRLLAPPAGLTLSLQHWEGSLNWGHITTEEWVQPIRDARGEVDFRTVWSGTVEVENAGNTGGGREDTCGWMAPSEDAGKFIFRRSSFYGEQDPCAGVVDFSLLPTLECSRRIEETRKCGAAEVDLREVWATENGELKRISATARRADQRQSETFPFDLPVSGRSWKRSGTLLEVVVFPKKMRLLLSPDESYWLEAREKGVQEELWVYRAVPGRRHVRTIVMSQGDYFDGKVQAIGWASDSKRFFAVVSFGASGDRALLSFSVKGQDDRWEKLLTTDPQVYTDGFVLEPLKDKKAR